MIRYKLTDQNMKTYNGFQWKIGKKMITSGSGELCSSGWLHCYSDPNLAILFNPIHANIQNPRLFKVECAGLHKTDKGLKEGFTEMTIIEEITIPSISSIQKIEFSIYCSLQVYKDSNYVNWANNWLNNIDRSESAARTAAWTAARTAESAAWTAAQAAQAAESAAWTAESAAQAAESAARTAAIDFISIINKVLNRTK